MRTVILYASIHHGNTEKVVKAIHEKYGIDIIDVVKEPVPNLADYDLIGLASGVFYSKLHKKIIEVANQLPSGKKVFVISTFGGTTDGVSSVEGMIRERQCVLVGKYGCKGYDTFGPFKLVGGIAKGHPNQKEIDDACQFYASIAQEII